jgi:hypothetical protein
MKASSLNELQKELATLPPKRVIEVCVRVIKHKKENKELLSYLLFESADEEAFVSSVKKEIDNQFEDMNQSNLYLAKKTIRKILRMINKNIKFSGIKQTEVDLRIYYCKKLKDSGLKITKSLVLENLYNNQLKKIELAMSKLHEDLQFDFLKEVESLELKKSTFKLFK